MDQPVGQEQMPPAEASPETPRRWRRWVVAVVVAAAVAVSGLYFLSHRVDPAGQDATFIAKVKAATGTTPKDPARLVAAARQQCEGGSAALKYLAGLIHDNNATNVRTLARIGLSVYCPDLSAEFEQDLGS